MTRAARALLSLAVAVVALVATSAGAADAGRAREVAAPRRTLIITAPALTWEQVRDARPRAMLELFERSAAASMSVRTVGRRSSPGKGYATIGAGNRATVDEEVAGLAFEPDEVFEGRKAKEAHAIRSGSRREADVVHVAFAEVAARNAALRYGAVPGGLGDALRDAGRTVAVVGNADTTIRPQLRSFHREVALAGIDHLGAVDGGAVAREILARDPAAPFGLRLDRAQVRGAVSRALSEHDLVILELSDLDRADHQALSAVPEQAAQLRVAAIRSSDDLVADALSHVDLSVDQVIFVTSSSSRSGIEHLGVAAFAGPGFEPGLARSGTTRRSGYVTLPDVAPTVLTELGIDIPSSMTGAPVATGSARSSLPLDDLVRADRRATFRDRVHGATSVTFIVVQVLGYAAALLVLRRRKAAAAVAAISLVTLAVPPAGFALGLLDLSGLATAAFLLLLYATAAVIAGVAYAAFRRRAWGPPVAMLTVLLVILLVDVVTGGYLQLDTVFGYSPIVAGRFAGYGNLAFALLAASALVVATTLADAPVGSRRTRLMVAAAILAVVVVVDGAPFWGSDVGGVLALVPGFVVAIGMVAGARLGWRRLAASGAAAVVIVVAFAAIDMARPAARQTHLGRLAERVLEGEGVLVILERKAAANLSLLTSSVWTLIIPAAVAFLAYLIWRPPRLLPEVEARTPGLRPCLIGALVVGALGFALNDSGVAVPAMMLATLLPYVAYLIVVDAASRGRPGPATALGSAR